tara:strand:- start:584 stop:1393 length:810 start_codon:yes stop_codon:yes gene_type:complete
MNKENEFSIQAKRLMKFFESTGYSVNGFAQECNIPSTRTMTQIFTGGRPPSRKVLDKIIARFPALNHDWVILGYGEMIIPGMTKQASGNSVLKSKGAAFQQISDKQIETSFGINELARKVEQAMALNAQTTQILTNKVEQMAIAIKDGQDFIVDKEKKRDAFFQQMHANEMVKIQSLDKKRVATIERLDTERRVNREEGQEKLSQKIYEYLKESREMLYDHTKNNAKNAVAEIIKHLDIALNKAKDEAVNESHEKFNVEMGKHTINKKP